MRADGIFCPQSQNIEVKGPSDSPLEMLQKARRLPRSLNGVCEGRHKCMSLPHGGLSAVLEADVQVHVARDPEVLVLSMLFCKQ